MGLTADLVNGVRDLLKAKMASGQPLEYVKKLFFGGEVSTNLALPAIKVSLAPYPDVEEAYNGSGDKKDATLLVNVECIIEEKPSDGADGYPYGKSGDPQQRGILTFTDDIKNVLDDGRDSLLGANGKAYDMNCKLSGFQKADAKQWQAVVQIEFKTRFPHGGR